MICLTAEQVLFLHARLVSETGGSHGVRDLNLLLSASGRPQAGIEDRYLSIDILAKASALMGSLIRNHPFLDGNKRTGIAAAVLFLKSNWYSLSADNAEIEAFSLGVAQSQRSVDEMAAWFQTHIRAPDSR